MDNNQNIKSKLLNAWEETYKKGQLTLWVFLALKESPKYVPEIRKFILENSGNTISCEEQSLYRTLRKFLHLEMIEFSTAPGNKGPVRKYYSLSQMGTEILNSFIERNIHLFFKENVKKLLNTDHHETDK